MATAVRTEDPPLRRSAAAALADPVERTCYGLVLLSLAIWGWAASRSYFRHDDFIYFHRAVTEPLTLDFLFTGYQGHLMPGQFLIVEGIVELAPLSWTAAVAVVLLFRLVACVAAVRLLVALFGRRPGILAPLALYLFSPLLVLPFLWWAAALQVLSLQAALVLAALAHVRWLRSGRPRDAALSVAAVAGGLLFWEKALLIPVVLVGLGLLARRAGLPAAAGRALPYWAAHGLLVTGYLALYLTRTEGAGRDASAASVGDVAALAREAVLGGFLPGLVGGPWRGGYFGSLPPEPAVGAVVVAAVLVAAVVAVTCLLRPRIAVPAWLGLAVYLGFDVGLVAGLRLDFLGPALGRDPRYTADAVVVAALALGFALLPLAGARTHTADAVAGPEPDLFAERPARPEPPGDGPAAAPGDRLARLRDRLTTRPAASGPVPPSLVLLAAYLVSCLITTGLSAQHMADTSGREYVETARGELAQQAGVSVWDGAVPDDVLGGVFNDNARVSRVFSSLPEPPRFNEPTADLRMVDGLGLLRGVTMLAEARGVPGPNPDCGYGVQAGQQREVPLAGVTRDRRQVVRVGYYNGRAVPGAVTVDGVPVRVTFQQGLHYVYVVAPGPVRSVGLSVDASEVGAGFCATDVVVGQPWPAADR